MNSKKYILGICTMVFMLQFASAQNGHKELREGDAAYKSEDYAKAEEEYLRALEENPESVKGHFNRANSIYKGLENAELESEEELTKRLDKAAEEYQNAIQKTDNDKIKADAYHNLGNTMVQKQDLEKGIEAYKNALRLNPNDLNTKKNLYLTQKYLQQQQQQQQNQDSESGEGEQQEGEQQEQQEQENQENQEQQENQNSEQQEQEQEQKEQQESQSENEQQSGEEKKEEQAQPTPEELTKEEVLRQLKVMDDEEKKVQSKLRKEGRSEYKSTKDW